MKNRIGIIGGGQLGRMLGFEAKKMGFIVAVMDATPHSPAGQVVDLQLEGGYSDPEMTEELAEISDFLTVEIEHINTETLKKLVKQGIKVNPSPETIEIIKDKFVQKQFLLKHKIPTAPYAAVIPSETLGKRNRGISNTRADKGIEDLSTALEMTIEEIAKKFTYPIILKKRFDAFDGRGNYLIQKRIDIRKALEKLGTESLYVEKVLPFVKELAVVIARDMKGNIAAYPVVETIHKNNICHIVIAPAKISSKLQKKAQTLAKKVMKQIKGAGVFAIEMFLDKKGNVLVNEIAPRVHNSGHYTIEACYTSQFEQHIRAITGLPLGSTAMKVPAAVMINILGERKGEVDVKHLEKVLHMPQVSVHIYGKAETKPERKMGHITVLDETVEKAYKKAIKAKKMLHI